MFSLVSKILQDNGLIGCTYIEPYAGGAGLALSLLFCNYVDRIILNDIDRSIYAFWYSVLAHTDEMCELVEKTPITIGEYRRQKEIYRNSKDLLELGFATLFLNRTNRSGILTGGPVGGYSQTGPYKLDCRFNRENVVNAIRQVAAYKGRIELQNLDGIKFLKDIRSRNFRSEVLFIDPPYYRKGKELYTNFYSHEEHRHLAEVLTTTFGQTSWLLTYDNAEEIREMYTKRHVPYTYLELRYNAAAKRSESELLFFNRLEIPVPCKEAVRKQVRHDSSPKLLRIPLDLPVPSY